MRRALAAAAITAVLTGCGGDGGLNKAGTKDVPRTRVLTMATTDLALYDSPGLPEFVRAVKRRSGGRLEVRLRLTVHTEIPRQSEPVSRGDFDLGWEGSGFPKIRAWDIPFLPFLVDSFELQRALFEAGYDEALLESLDGTPLVGLAVLAGGLARPYTIGEPIDRAADWRGARLLSPFPIPPTRARAFRAAGVARAQADGYPTPENFRAGRVETIDWLTTGLQINNIGVHGVTGTFNVATMTRPIAIVGSRRRLARLSERERGWLREAAQDATRVALERAGADEQETLALNCRTSRLRGVLAPEEEVRALRERVASAYRAVTDPRFRELLHLVDSSRSRVPTTDAVVPVPCRGPVPDLPVVQRSTRPRALDGRYRFDVAVEDFLRGGIADRAVASDFAGHWTALMKDGRATIVRRVAENNLFEEPIKGTMDYRVDEDRVTFIPTFSPLVTDPAPPVTLRWRREPSGALEFDPVYPLDWFNSALFGVEWARVR